MKKIKLQELIFGAIIILLIVLRIFIELPEFLFCVNCISVMLAMGGICFNIVASTDANEKRNFFVGLSVIIMIVVIVLVGWICAMEITVSNRINDILTLLALLLTMSPTVFEKVLRKIFNLS